MCREFKIQNEAIPRIAAGFGGGVGNTGSVCGAVVGAIMALGLIKGRRESVEDWFRLAALAQEFRNRFETEMGTISCRELTGLDLTSEEGREQLMNSERAATVCVSAVGIAYNLVIDLLKKAP